MLITREDTQNILKEAQTPDWQPLCFSAIERELPADLRATAYALFNLDENGKAFVYQSSDPEAAQRFYKAIEERLQRLNAMTPEERLAIFAILIPRVAANVETAW